MRCRRACAKTGSRLPDFDRSTFISSHAHGKQIVMERNRVEGFMWSAVCATLVWWTVVLFMRNTFPFERSWWHFAVGALLAVFSIALLVWCQSFPWSDGRRIWSTLLRPAGAETPSADLVDPSPAEPPPLTEAGPPVDEGPQPVVPTIESNPATAGPPIDPPSQPTSSAAPSGQISRDFPQSRATWSPRYSPRSCAYKPVPAAGRDSPSTSTGPS